MQWHRSLQGSESPLANGIHSVIHCVMFKSDSMVFTDTVLEAGASQRVRSQLKIEAPCEGINQRSQSQGSMAGAQRIHYKNLAIPSSISFMSLNMSGNNLLAWMFWRICLARHSLFSSSVVSESEVCAGEGGSPDATRYEMRCPFGMLLSGTFWS